MMKLFLTRIFSLHLIMFSHCLFAKPIVEKLESIAVKRVVDVEEKDHCSMYVLMTEAFGDNEGYKIQRCLIKAGKNNEVWVIDKAAQEVVSSYPISILYQANKNKKTTKVVALDIFDHSLPISQYLFLEIPTITSANGEDLCVQSGRGVVGLQTFMDYVKVIRPVTEQSLMIKRENTEALSVIQAPC